MPKENAGEVTAEVAAEESAAGAVEEEEREPGEVVELEEPPAGYLKEGGACLGEGARRRGASGPTRLGFGPVGR